MKRPNILLILTDQQHHGMMRCADNPWLDTPNMDRLAARGTRFSRTYCTNPVCIPSRFSLFTGRMPSAIGMRANDDSDDLARFDDAQIRACLGHRMRDAGYRTVYGGKVHCPIGLTAERLGFDYLCQDDRDRLAVEAADFVRNAPAEPWMLVTSFINPHDICLKAIQAFADTEGERAILRVLAQDVAEMEAAGEPPPGVDEATFFDTLCPPLPANHEPQAEEPELIRAVLDERPFKRKAREQWGEREWRLHRWCYHRLTERVDRQIGVVLDALERGGQRDDTIVIFTSDHGDHNGAHRLEHKTFFYEEAARVPLIVAGPGAPENTVVDDRLVSNGLDLLPTCLDYAGVAAPEHCRGRSLRPLLEDRSADWRDAVYGENCVGHMVAARDWKYVRYDSGAHAEQLYDLAADPGETRNHADDHPEILARMRERLDHHRREHARRALV